MTTRTNIKLGHMSRARQGRRLGGAFAWALATWHFCAWVCLPAARSNPGVQVLNSLILRRNVFLVFVAQVAAFMLAHSAGGRGRGSY